MIRILADSHLEIRSSFLSQIRRFFVKKTYLEIETPLLNPGGNVEAFIDPFQIQRSISRKSPEDRGENKGRYLITSPEYNLKVQFTSSSRNLYQIAHCFREGDMGQIHSEEFLMLEWYKRNCTLREFIQETMEMIHELSKEDFSKQKFSFNDIEIISAENLFLKYAGCGLAYKDLLECATKKGYLNLSAEIPRYDEVFFILFLNDIEKHLGMKAPAAVYPYPEELAALSRIRNGSAERFEIYWKGIELANGYEELPGREENLKRFQHENSLRTLQNKNTVPHEEQFLECMDRLPQSCGAALGLDRLLMVLLNENSLSSVSPFI